MMTFVFAAAVLVGALCVAAALDEATTEAPLALFKPNARFTCFGCPACPRRCATCTGG
jgi:hypothetical protein